MYTNLNQLVTVLCIHTVYMVGSYMYPNLYQLSLVSVLFIHSWEVLGCIIQYIVMSFHYHINNSSEKF